MRKARRRRVAPPALLESGRSLLDLVDNVLTRGVVLTGDVTLGVADVDLVYLRLQTLLCAADRVFDQESRRRDRRVAARGVTGTRGQSLPLRGTR